MLMDLTLFQKNPNELFDLLNKRRKRENIILTPHEGEFNRLFDFGNISKIDKANRAANITKSTILFKGNDTIISSPKKISLITKDSSSFFSYRWIRRCIIRYMWKLSRTRNEKPLCCCCIMDT